MENNTDQKESLNVGEGENKAEKKSISISVKTAIIVAVVLIIGALGYYYKGILIAATVNGNPIMRLTVIRELEKASGKSLLDSLITEKLITNEASAKKIVITDDEINAAIKIIENQVVAQGGTLEAALKEQGMTMNDFKQRIILQKDLEKLVADKVNVTDDEVAQYIKDNKTPVPKGQEAAVASKIKEELKNKKLQTETQSLVTELRAKAKISYFVNY